MQKIQIERLFIFQKKKNHSKDTEAGIWKKCTWNTKTMGIELNEHLTVNA